MTSTIGQQLSGWDVSGAARRWSLTDLRAGLAPISALSTRIATLDGDTEAIIRGCLPIREPTLRAAAERLLDNEIRAGLRLTRRYPTGGYPPELAELVGYNFEGAEPFAIFAPYRGAPAASVVRRLIGQKPQRFAASLLRAVAHLAAVDLVHGAISLDVLYVDGVDDPTGPVVQLFGFEHTVAIGEHRLPRSRAHPGDDVLAAGRVLVTAFARTPAGFAGPPDLRGTEWLERALAGVFVDDPARRPSATDVLHRLTPGAAIPCVPLPGGQDLEPGRRRFDEVRAYELGKRMAGPAPAQAPPPTSSAPERQLSGAAPSAQPAAPDGSSQPESSSGREARVIVSLMVVAVVVLLALAWMERL